MTSVQSFFRLREEVCQLLPPLLRRRIMRFFGKTSGWPNAHSVDAFFVFFAITALTRAIGDAIRLVGK